MPYLFKIALLHNYNTTVIDINNYKSTFFLVSIDIWKKN